MMPGHTQQNKWWMQKQHQQHQQLMHDGSRYHRRGHSTGGGSIPDRPSSAALLSGSLRSSGRLAHRRLMDSNSNMLAEPGCSKAKAKQQLSSTNQSPTTTNSLIAGGQVSNKGSRHTIDQHKDAAVTMLEAAGALLPSVNKHRH
jgi:hypothetical protein